MKTLTRLALTRLKRHARLAVATMLLAAVPAAASAHHSAAPHFDLQHEIVVTGVVTKFELVNPHGYVYFKVSGPKGERTEWRCELPARTSLARLGWTVNTFVPGRSVTIKGAPARREEHVCMLNSFTGEDGIEITRNQDLSKLNPTPEAATVSARQIERPARLANGLPNLRGPWVALDGPGGRGGRGRGREGRGGPRGDGGPGRPGGPGRGGPGGPPGAPEATAAGLVAAQSYDQRFDDPAIKCSPADILFGWTHDQNVNEVVQKPDEIVLQYGYMDFVRTIHMKTSQHPKTITPSLGGHSIGTWDGDTLVVDTVGFKPSVLIPITGLMHSGQMHVVERFSVDPVAKILTRTFRAEDPLYLKSDYTGTNVMTLSTEPFSRFNCVELSGKNNIRPK